MESTPSPRPSVSRRDFIQLAGGTALAGLAASATASAAQTRAAEAPLYKISLAEWSINRPLFGGTMQHLDFAKIAKSVGIDAIEYVNQFFKDKAKDTAYLTRDERARQGRGRHAGAHHVRRRGEPRRSRCGQAPGGGREPLQVGRGGEVARLPHHPRQRLQQRHARGADEARRRRHAQARASSPTRPRHQRRHREPRRAVEQREVARADDQAGRPPARRHAAGLRQLPHRRPEPRQSGREGRELRLVRRRGRDDAAGQGRQRQAARLGLQRQQQRHRSARR